MQEPIHSALLVLREKFKIGTEMVDLEGYVETYQETRQRI
jgi:hypothetical protein